MAYTQKCLLNHDKFIVGLHTDMRGAFGFLDAKLNPMLLGAFDDVVEDEAALIAALTTYQRARQQ